MSSYHMKGRQLKPADPEPPTFFSTEFDRGVVPGDGGLDSTGAHDILGDPTRHPMPYHQLHPGPQFHHQQPPPPQHHHQHQQHQMHPHHAPQHQQPPPPMQQQPPPQQHQVPPPQPSPMAAAPNPKKRQRAPKAQPAAPIPQQQQQQQQPQPQQQQQPGTMAPPTNNGQPVIAPPPPAQPAKRSRTNTAWTQQEEQLLKQMRDQGASWSDIAKKFPTRTEGSVKKHWYKDMHWAEFGEEESAMLLAAIKEYDANKWKVIGAKVNKPAKACEAYAKEHFAGKI